MSDFLWLQAPLFFTVSWSLLKFLSTELVMPSNHLIPCCPLLLPPSVFPSIRVFSNELALCIRWPECWSFSFSISPSNEHSGLTSFRIDWFDHIGAILWEIIDYEVLAQSLETLGGSQTTPLAGRCTCRWRLGRSVDRSPAHLSRVP